MKSESRYYNAIVKRVMVNGVKLDLGVEKPGYLHVSKMKPRGEFVANAADVVRPNDVIPVCVWKFKASEVEARVQRGRGTCKQNQTNISPQGLPETA